MIVDKSVEIGDMSKSDIGEIYNDMKDTELKKIGSYKKVNIDIKDFYEEVYFVDYYCTDDKVYLARAVEYESDVYFEFIEYDDDLQELGEDISHETYNIDKVVSDVGFQI